MQVTDGLQDLLVRERQVGEQLRGWLGGGEAHPTMNVEVVVDGGQDDRVPVWPDRSRYDGAGP